MADHDTEMIDAKDSSKASPPLDSVGDTHDTDTDKVGSGFDKEQEDQDPEANTDLKDSMDGRIEEASLLPSADHVQIHTRARREAKNKLFLILLTGIAALGGFLFGYNTGVVSGAMLNIKKTFHLTTTWQEVIVSVTIGAAAVAAAVSGVLCDLIGRKPTLIIASVVFTIGAAVMGAALNAWMLMIGRIIVGLGIGAAAMASPMYIAESAPSHMRGKLVVLNNMFITGGQFIATLVDGAFSYLPIDLGWRFMLGLAGLPSVLMFLGMLFMPESPRWLVYHGKEEKALKALAKVRPPNQVMAELESIKEDYEKQKKLKLGFINMLKRLLTTRTVLFALLVGCGLQLFQQFGGINTVMYYSASIFEMAGFSGQNAIWLATVPGFVNFIFTAVGLLLVDRLGRRKLLIGSISGTIIGFGLLTGTFALMDRFSPAAVPFDTVNGTCQYYSCGACVGNSRCGFCVDYDAESRTYFNGTCSLGVLSSDGSTTYSKYQPFGSNTSCSLVGENWTSPYSAFGASINNETIYRRWWDFNTCPQNRLSPLAILALIVYIGSFASGAGPLPWTVNAEIYPTWARSTSIAIATTVNWCSNLIISMTFLTMADGLGQPVTFGVYAVLSIMGLLFVILLLPETRGKKLEDIEKLFKRPHFLNWCRRKKVAF